MEIIWDYYKKLADITGKDKDGKVTPYSVSWFYEGEAEGVSIDRLNTLSRAFLGDEESLGEITVADENELRGLRNRISDICGAAINPSQVEAISNAVLNDITIIQGPPGTGKTDTIKNILKSLRGIRPEATIAVVSANSEAINNAEDEVKKDETLIDQYARLGMKSIREKYKKNLRYSAPSLYRRLSFCCKANQWKYPASFLENRPIVFSTIHSLRKCVDTDVYDYVIVDECSQVASMIGMLAIASARHLVLLGDDEQLPPINKDEAGRAISEAEVIRQQNDWYLDENDNSFMKACRCSFREKAPVIFLNEHYRCHPAIIGFCNKYVYDGKLITKTTDDGKLPIRIRWYEGDYWERIEKTDDRPASNYNRKQTEVFMKDEYSGILKRLVSDRNYSICVLSPYRAQLEELQRRISESEMLDGVGLENEIKQPEDNVNEIPQLTIHKAQGRGYDMVYIMPVQDAGVKPWSQNKKMMNVAISRAKKELCVITSSTWMPENLQKKLTGYVLKHRREPQGEYYLMDLLQYVADESERRDIGSEYGFKKSSLVSVFDKNLYYRYFEKLDSEMETPDENIVNRISSPEKCMLEALKGCSGLMGYDIKREVLLKDIPGITSDDEKVKRYIENGARIDFAIYINGILYAIIEVDGAYHRSDPEMIEKDALKDRAIASLGAEFVRRRYFRFPTDGTVGSELHNLDKVLKNNWR